MELSYIYIMKIKAKRDWMDIKTQRNFAKGGVYEVNEVYGNKIVGIGHAELVEELKEEKPKKAKAKKK